MITPPHPSARSPHCAATGQTIGTQAPSPLRLVEGAPPGVALTFSVAVLFPAGATALNVSKMVQLPPAATGVMQLFVAILNSDMLVPPRLTVMVLVVTPPVLRSTKSCAALEPPPPCWRS